MFKEKLKALKFDSVSKSIVIPIVIMLVANVAIAGIISEIIGKFLPSDNPIAIGGAIGMVLNVVLSTVLVLKVSKIKMKDLGLSSKKAVSSLLAGALLGLVILSLVGITIKLIGGVNIEYVYQSSFLIPILIGLLFFAFQGFWEELIFRSYLMTHFAKKMGIPIAILVSSVLFTLIHALNPGMTVVPVVNLMTFSVVFSLVYLVTGNLWLTGLFHSLWNFSQGVIFGALVSGVSLKETVFKSIPATDNTLISGGNFGFEGSIVTTIVGVVLIIILFSMAKKRGAFETDFTKTEIKAKA